MADIAELQSTQQTASTDLSNLQTSIPGLLQNLRQNLVSIYAKDNPLIQARDEALSRFLSGGDVARAELLPGNLPQVAGSPLTLSPTQQNAIVSSRQAANQAPLIGLNQAVSQGYGNIGDIVKGAGDIYGSQVQAATTNLAQAVKAYENAVSQDRWEKEQAEKTRQFNVQEQRLGKGILGLGLDNNQPSNNTPPINEFWEEQEEDFSIPTPAGPATIGQTPPVNLFTSNGQLIPGLSFNYRGR